MSPVLSKRIREEVRARSEIAEVIGHYFQLKSNGPNFKALCPFHKEKTPSFHVNRQRQIFHCFGCGAGGDVFKFIMLYEGVDFTAAARTLADRAGMSLGWEGGEESAKSGEKDALYRLHTEVATLYHQELRGSPRAAAARDYLARRQLGDEVIREFMIGYAPSGWDWHLSLVKQKGYSQEQIMAAGLTIKSDRPDASIRYYDRFRNRIMFPIRDEQGRIIAFSGRTLGSDPKEAKYVNSPETLLFRKGTVLFALDLARRPIVESREVILCEGQIDVIRCHSCGFKTAVAAQGTAFTEDHARILKRYADGVVLVFDPDDAGLNAAIRATAVFMQIGMAVRIALLPAGEDPDSFLLKEGADAFQAVLDQARTAIEFHIEVLARRENLRTEIGLKRVEAAVLQTINLANSAVQRDRMIQLAAQRLGLHPNDLQKDLAQMNLAARPRPTREAQVAPADPAPPREELSLVEHLAQAPEFVPLLTQYLPLDLVSHPLCRDLLQALIKSHTEGRLLLDAVAHNDDSSLRLTSFAATILSAPRKTTGREASSQEAIQGLIAYIWGRELKRRRADLQRQLPAQAPHIPPDLKAEREISQLTHDIKMLADWETALPVIEMHRSVPDHASIPPAGAG